MNNLFGFRSPRKPSTFDDGIDALRANTGRTSYDVAIDRTRLNEINNDLFASKTEMNNPFGFRSPRKSTFDSSIDSLRATAGRTSYDATVDRTRLKENNDDYYTSKKKIDDDRGSLRTFYPITEVWKNEKAEQFKIKVIKSFKFGHMKNFYDRTAPKETISVQGDGNCFFRAISMCIIGSEHEHIRVRELITKHVGENPELYRTFLLSRGGMNQYLTSMRRPREWATDVEILAAATLLKTVIEVYFPCRIKGNVEFRWQTFKPLTHQEITYPVIYLSNKNDHFDPVLDVEAEVEIISRRDTQQESPRRSRDNYHDPSVYSTPVSKSYNHDSTFNRIHGRPGSNYSNSNSHYNQSRSHPNVQF
ncbi:uncharacterized protein LOC143068633 [Mytilus galloprovincialis]|uniref:uncharacterized protein LOC143068633 n=1 Tax=Mytilus galloprovincialis TaxID=29158 RepID=UPI003F7C589E